MPICCKTSSFSSVAGAIAGIGTAGTVPDGIGVAMHSVAASAGAARRVGIAGAFRPGDRGSVPAGLAAFVPVGLVPVVEPVPDVPVDLAQWRVLAVVVQEAEGRVAVEVAADQVVAAVEGVVAVEAEAAARAAAVANGSVAAQRA